jgi:hypothetical protein
VTTDAATVVVWLSEAPADARSSALLSSWARERGLTLVSPRFPAWTPLPVDLSIAAAVEDRLESARDALVAGSGPDIDRAIESAADLLGAHPQLPNAAWLMAEVERLRSARWRRLAPIDTTAADRAWTRAAALDGGRSAGPGEQASSGPEPATVTLEMHAWSGERVWLDGAPVGPGPVSCRAGPHNLVVAWQQGPVWASWIEVPPGVSAVGLSALDAPACSTGDLGDARVEGNRVLAGEARCPRWVAAAPGTAPDSIRLATCEAGDCSALADWRPVPIWAQPRPPDADRGSHWPAWATWSLVGTGAAVATAVVVGLVAGQQTAAKSSQFVLGPLNTN